MEPAGSTFFYPFAVFVLAAPLYKAGNRAVPLLLLELAAIALLLALALRRSRVTAPALPWPLRIALALALAYPLLQLVPLPDALWRMLPGRANYASIIDHFATPASGSAWRPISVAPAATEYGWLALLPPLACLFGARALATAQVARLLLAMVILVGLEGMLGLVQVGAGGDSIFSLRNTQTYGMATGTFVNRDHFAALLAMMLPVIVGLLVFDARRRRHDGRLHSGHGANLVSQRALIFASAVLVLLCLIFTFSRGGIATALIGLALSSILLQRARPGQRHARWLVPALVVAGIALAALIGLAPVLDRFGPEELRLSGGGRLALSAATLRAAAEFVPFGSGLSTFSVVFPRFQADVFGGYVDYAHNDFLQLFLEVGLVAPLLVVLAVATYAIRMRELLRRTDARSFTLLQIAAGIALVPPFLHAMFDFALHMPACAMWFAALAGVMLHPGATDREQVRPLPRGGGDAS